MRYKADITAGSLKVPESRIIAGLLLQAALDAGAKKLLLPMASVADIPTVPGELFAKFQTEFYADPRDAAFKVMGVE